MHLFDPLRPEVIPGQKAVLADGGAIPNFILCCQPNGMVRVSALLRKYDTHGGYSYHNIELPADELKLFFELFRASPEDALEDYFNWVAKPSATVVPSFTLTAVPDVEIDDFL